MWISELTINGRFRGVNKKIAIEKTENGMLYFIVLGRKKHFVSINSFTVIYDRQLKYEIYRVGILTISIDDAKLLVKHAVDKGGYNKRQYDDFMLYLPLLENGRP